MIPIVGFAPDADIAPGILSDCSNLVPSLSGYKAAQSLATPSGVPALSAACVGAATVTKLDGSRRIFAGTATKLYELSGGAWTDVSDTGSYTGVTNWSIAQFGNSTLAADKAYAIQRSTTAAFAAISGAPKATIVFTVGTQVMALNVNDGTDKPDGWHCCAVNDETDWTPSSTTLANSGRLVSTPGSLTAGGRLGDYAVAYKSRSIYIGQFIGAPVVWDWQLIGGGTAGCVGQNAWCDVNGIHFVVGEDNFWMFDGIKPVPLADGVIKDWFASNCSETYKYKIACAFDKTTNLVWVFYPSSSASTLDSALVYHVQKQKWGRVTVSIETVMEFVTPSSTFNDLDDYSATYDGMPAIPFDSPLWVTGARSLVVFNTSHQAQSFSGSPGSSSMTTESGDDYAVTLLSRLKLRLKTAPTTALVLTYVKQNSGDSYMPSESATMENGTFDLLQSARWHKAEFYFTGPVEITAMGATYEQDGEE